METLSMNEMEQIEGGDLSPEEVVGIACGSVVLATIFGGPAGILVGAALGPTACIANPIIVSAA